MSNMLKSHVSYDKNFNFNLNFKLSGSPYLKKDCILFLRPYSNDLLNALHSGTGLVLMI